MPCQFPESILHPPHTPPLLSTILTPHSLCPSKQCPCQDNYTNSLPHTLTRRVYHWRAGGSKAISSWCECCISLSLSASQSLMARLAPQTSDLISDISAVIATGTSLHPATSSASASYFCWEVVESWQAQQQHKPRAASSTLWVQCVLRLSPNPQALPAPLCLHSQSSSTCGHAGFISHIHPPRPHNSRPSYSKEQPQSQLYDTVHHGCMLCISSPDRFCLVVAVCAWNRWMHDMI